MTSHDSAGNTNAVAQNYLGHRFVWKLTGAQTGGQFALAEVTGWQGGEPPLHVHAREDEIFSIIEGRVVFRIGDETITAAAGDVVWAPRNVPHAFMFETPIVRMLIGFSPAGQDAVFQAFSTVDDHERTVGPPAEQDMPDMAAMTAMDEAAGVTYLGPPLRDSMLDPAA
jgi:quercetin dioxygenase-like cupin family protein